MTIPYTLPEGVIITTKKGEKINIGDDIGNRETLKAIDINISEKLKIPPQAIFTYLQKIIGEKVEIGDIIAQKKTVFGIKKYISEYAGLLKNISHTTGQITIEAVTEEQTNIPSPIKGVVEQVENNAIIFSLDTTHVFAMKDGNYDCGGDTFYFKDEGMYFTVDADQLENKIIIIEEAKNHIISKCEALGSRGFIFLKGSITSSIPYAKIKAVEDFEKIMTLHKKHTFFSLSEKKILVYD